jgi:3-oxoacyl-[acyl-carrier protein] reductase
MKNMTAVVTGGGKGIGRAISKKLSNVCDIAIIYVGDPTAAHRTAEEIISGRAGAKCKIYECDVSDFNAVRATVAEIIADFSSVQILVNNAGITRDKLILNMSEEDFDKVMAVNLKGAFNMIKHLYPHFLKNRYGRIINISSIAGLDGNAGQANYAASKAALVGLTKSTARELAARNITCNAIAPGFIDTDMTKSLSDELKRKAIEKIPAKRMGTAEDVADLAAFLAGTQSGYVTGQVIRIDGGLTL